MKLLQTKLSRYDAPQIAKEKGVYPYFREITSDQDTEVKINGKKVLMFGSNSYLGLTNHPKIKEAAIKATKKYGTGCAGSRFLNGTLDIHTQLEKRLAKFVGKEDALVYSTGFQVNLGVVSCLTGREDYIITDESDHASIVDGFRLSFSKRLKYRHNDMFELEQRLKMCDPDAVKLVVTDGVFSMEGDVPDLPKMVELCKQYNAALMVDEAHGIGVFGRNGRGVCDHFGVPKEQKMLTLSWVHSVNHLHRWVVSLLPMKLLLTSSVTTLVHISSRQVSHLLQQQQPMPHLISWRASPNVSSAFGM